MKLQITESGERILDAGTQIIGVPRLQAIALQKDAKSRLERRAQMLTSLAAVEHERAQVERATERSIEVTNLLRWYKLLLDYRERELADIRPPANQYTQASEKSPLQNTEKVTGTSADRVRRHRLRKLPDIEVAERVYERSRKAGELFTVKAVIEEQRIIQVAERRQELRTEAALLTAPAAHFDIVVIDPPWQCEVDYNPRTRRSAPQYPTMSTAEVSRLSIPHKPDAWVFVWGIDALLAETLEVIEDWSLQRLSTIIWDKTAMGMGHWVRLQHEYCFVCRAGNPPEPRHKDIRSVIQEARRQHSQKPDAFYEIIDRNFEGSRLDYFGRTERPGWVIYGNERIEPEPRHEA